LACRYDEGCQIDWHVYSVDLKAPSLKHSAVSFIKGDCLKIEAAVSNDFLRDAPHPWLLIEDAHVNVYGVLCYFHLYLWRGDYVVIEDSDSEEERKAISSFIAERPNCYKVDTYYTDFFDRNATCAQDSIFARIS
jgi:cephalosporin hydroxylase